MPEAPLHPRIIIFVKHSVSYRRLLSSLARPLHKPRLPLSAETLALPMGPSQLVRVPSPGGRTPRAHVRFTPQ